MKGCITKPAFLSSFLYLALILGLSGCGASVSLRGGRPYGEVLRAEQERLSKPSNDTASKGGGSCLLDTARSQMGVRYRFGGDSPKGFDCSGLAWWTHHQCGIDIARTSFKQYRGGSKVGRSNLRPGDLVFFTTYKSGPSHVGIYDGDGHFVHAPSSGRTVSRTSMDNSYWKPRFVGARRYW